MKVITKKLLLASVAVGVLNPLTFGVVYADSSNNEVTVTDDDYTINGETTEYDGEVGNVFGGNSGASIDDYDIVGGTSEESDANNNTVNIQGGRFIGTVYGGITTSGAATNNTVIINGGTINTYVFGAWGESQNLIGNTITLNSGTVSNRIYAAFLHGNSTAATVSENTANINGGTAEVDVHGGQVYNGITTQNTVNISGGTVGRHIFGGYVSVSGTATANTINISGGTISGNILGGWNVNGNVTDNTINIYGDPNISNSEILGGRSADGISTTEDILFSYQGDSSNDVVTGNTLNIYTKNLTAKNIYNFETINFYLPESTVNGDTILTLSETSTDISGAVVNAGVAGNANLNNGDTVTLLTNAGTITTEGTTYGKLTEGVSLEYDLTVSKSGDNKIIATIGSVSSNDDNNGGNDDNTGGNDDNTDTSNLNDDNNDNSNNGNSSGGTSSGDSNSGGVTLRESTQLVTKHFNIVTPEIPPLPDDSNDFDFEEEGLDSFFDNEQKGWEVFANAGAGSMRYKVNNGYVDTTNQNIDLGFARNVGNMANKMTIAPVIDYQNTNYDSYLNDGTHARGNTKYTAGGLVLRNMNRNGFYYEGSFRAGQIKTDFASEDLATGLYSGQTITYDNSATVLNAHLKLGKYLRLNKNNLLNVYGFYYHTHQGSSGADLSSGDHYDFSSSNAGRLRLGYRLTTQVSKISRVYTGLAYQYEHNSGVTATCKGYSTPKESHNGSSGMLELGWLIKPLKDNPWSVDINATGWVGNQRGVKAMAKVAKSF